MPNFVVKAVARLHRYYLIEAESNDDALLKFNSSHDHKPTREEFVKEFALSAHPEGDEAAGKDAQ